MTDELDRIFAVMTAVLVAIEYGMLVVAEIRSSLRIEHQCRQLAGEAHELRVEVEESDVSAGLRVEDAERT